MQQSVEILSRRAHTISGGAKVALTLVTILASLGIIGALWDGVQRSTFNNEYADKIKMLDQASLRATPIGSIVPYGGGATPKDLAGLEELGWLPCDGRTAPRKTYAKLYEAVGDAFGAGDGETTFNLPDLRGRFVRGVNDNAPNTPANSRDSDATNRLASGLRGYSGDKVGSLQLGSTALPQNPFRTGFIGANGELFSDGGGAKLTFTGSNESGGNGSYFSNSTQPHGSFNPDVGLPNHDHIIGRGGDKETRPVNIAVHWLIRAKP